MLFTPLNKHCIDIDHVLVILTFQDEEDDAGSRALRLRLWHPF